MPRRRGRGEGGRGEQAVNKCVLEQSDFLSDKIQKAAREHAGGALGKKGNARRRSELQPESPRVSPRDRTISQIVCKSNDNSRRNVYFMR